MKCLADIAAIIEGFGSVIMLAIAIVQVRQMNKELKQANVQTCFNIELELYEARRRWEDALRRYQEWSNKHLKKTSTHNSEWQQFKLVVMELNAAKEAYYSELDRFCSYIYRGKLTETDFQEDWAPLISKLVDNDKGELQDKYDNIIKLNDKWN